MFQFLSRAPLKTKFVALAIMFSITLSVTGFLYLSVAGESVDFAQKEQAGNRHLTVMMDLWRLFHSPTADAYSQARKQGLDDLRKLDKDHLALLEFTASGLETRGRPQAHPDKIAAQLEATAPDSAQAVSAVIGSLQEAIKHAGDTSNLILDPDLDSYYLMDAVLLAVPEWQGAVWSFLLAPPEGRKEADLAVFRFRMSSLAERIVGDLKTALQEDEKFYGKSPSLHDKMTPWLKELPEIAGRINKLDPAAMTQTPQLISPVLAAELENLHRFWDEARTELDRLLLRREEHFARRRLMGLAALLSVGLAYLAFVFLLARGIVVPIGKTSTHLQSIGSTVASASGQLHAASKVLSTGAVEGAAAVEETSASIEALVTMEREKIARVQEISKNSEANHRNAEKGANELGKLMTLMSENVEMGRKVQEISTMIDSIAFQTNLLALNAAVEAARAGEQGKGFSVVAEAVRGLAQQSAASAKEISSILTNVLQRNEEGDRLARQGNSSLKMIVEGTRTISSLLTEMAERSREEALRMTEMSKAITQIDQTTQRTAAGAEQIAAQGEQLSGHAQRLAEEVAALNAVVVGSA